MKPYESNILQVPEEIGAYCWVLRREGIASYLEIGSKYGGSLWRAAMALPVGSRIVSIDLPNGTKAWRDSEAALKQCIADLCARGYDARVIWGDSRSKEVIHRAASWGPYDAIMIDADHRLAGVTADWANYGQMATRLVAFHDIAWHRQPEWQGVRIDVPQFWDKLKASYRHEEFKFCPTGKNNGIGVLWKN